MSDEDPYRNDEFRGGLSMSISIDVEGFFHLPDYPPFNSNTSVRRAHLQWRTEVLQLLCERMEWQSVPWGGPNGNAVPDGDSCSETSLLKLHDFARRLETLETEFRFPHLLHRYDDGKMAIYLPTEFDQPFEICPSSYPECCTISSSIRLCSELQQIKRHFEHYLKEIEIRSDDFERIDSVLEKLVKNSQLSVEMQLPMFMSW